MVELQQDVVAETAVSDPVNTPTNQSQIEPTDALTTTETAVDECLACHIDKEQLIATADPEEEVISENEGEG
ncbi:MAG: hypothetical protein R3E31_28600 [Chloroflexota bacterium]|nr:hypothetical protein [Anaerolineales bacterium]MCB8966469.1 hypothetical protein [Ardenticatenaceae bacterium]